MVATSAIDRAGERREDVVWNNLRLLVPMTDQEIEGLFARLGYAVTADELVFTTEAIDDFWFARYQTWADPGIVVRQDSGLLIIADAQPRKLSARRDVVVVGFVTVRAVLGVDSEESDLFADLPDLPVAQDLLSVTCARPQ